MYRSGMFNVHACTDSSRVRKYLTHFALSIARIKVSISKFLSFTRTPQEIKRKARGIHFKMYVTEHFFPLSPSLLFAQKNTRRLVNVYF